MTLKETNMAAIIYDDSNSFIGRRRVYEQPDCNDRFIYLNGWVESVRFLTERKGYRSAMEYAPTRLREHP